MPVLSMRAWIAAVAAVAALLTLLAGVTSVIDVAYESPSLHIAIETAAALISLLAGQLILGRYARSTQLADLLLGAGLTLLAFGNLALSAVPAIVEHEDTTLSTWGALVVRTLSAILLAMAAWVPDRPIRHPTHAARIAAAGGSAIVALLLIAIAAVGDALPDAAPVRSPTAPAFDASPGVLAQHLATAILYAVAAAGYARRAELTSDALMRWLAIACVLGAFSRANYLVHPSLGSDRLFAGDALRLAFFVALLGAGVQELRWAQRRLAAAAVLQERQRIARDIHDGMSQDLAFILQQGRALRRKLGPTPVIEQIVDAAQHALDESREAVATLVRPPSLSLCEALAQTAREAAEREGSTVDTEFVDDVAVPGSTQEVMLRVLREAVINAARHGRASRIRVELQDEPRLCLCITDDGRGFDVSEATAAPGHHGLRGMAERVRGIGGELLIDSEPGHGTQVRVVVE
jgi:signal transduction histidine kinase